MVRRFVGRVEEAALGVKVLKGVRPDQQLVKVVNDQLIELMGGQQEGLVEVKAGQTQVRVQDLGMHSTCAVPLHQQPMIPGGGQGWPDAGDSCWFEVLYPEQEHSRAGPQQATPLRANSAACHSARCQRAAFSVAADSWCASSRSS